MKLLTALTMAVVVLAGLAATDASANTLRSKRVNYRQNRQHNRIAQGDTSGSLTQRETNRLQRQQRYLARKEARFRASGNGMSASEAARLNAQQSALSANIYRQKHDAHTAQP